MRCLYQTLSVRSMTRRWLRAGLIALSVALGVATLVATQALNWTMARAAVFASNPTSGFADFIVANGDLPVPRSLEKELAAIPEIAEVDPRITGNAFVGQLNNRPVMVIGIDVAKAAKAAMENPGDESIRVDDATIKKYMALALASKIPDLKGGIFGNFLKATPLGDMLGSKNATAPPALVGRDFFDALPEKTERISLRRSKANGLSEFSLAGPYDATGTAKMLGGFVAVLDLPHAAKLFELDKKDLVHRFDIKLKPGADASAARAEIERVLAGRALVRTFAEQSQNTQNVMAGLQTGFSLCGLAALIVGLFLVYNAQSVTVAERRHEIGVLRSVGATRGQIMKLFAGEALFLGLVGSLIGIPAGYGLASLGLRPMRDVLADVFFSVDARELYVNWYLGAIAIAAGVLTTLFASLLPAFAAAHETPSDAVRKRPKAASVQSLVLHIAASLAFAAVGTLMILNRDRLPPRWGTLGGMCIVLIGGLLASPFLSGIIARMMQPFVRRFLSIEWRLAADNIVRSPGRTGLVIGALAAGVSLVVQTAGVISSNSSAINGWLDDALAVDLIVTSGNPVGSGGQMQPMPESMLSDIKAMPGVAAAVPVRVLKVQYGGTQIMMQSLDVGEVYRTESPRSRKAKHIDLYRRMDETPGGVIVSDNFAALHNVGVGQSIRMPSPRGEVTFKILGTIPDYSWTHGSMFVHSRDFLESWGDQQIDVIDIYMQPDASAESMKKDLIARWGGDSGGLFALTQSDLKEHINNTVRKVYGVAYGQLFVVMIVAALGVVTALLIAVLQRQHEMGLLRAVGASRGQVIASVLAEACLMGLIGTIIGLLVGVPLEWYVLNVVMLEEAGMLFPVVLPWKQAFLVAGGAMVTAIIAGLGPALYAVRQRIPDTIAYE
jgi:putative ABC transport system permease protein